MSPHLANTIPLVSPHYPPPPYRYRDCPLMVVPFVAAPGETRRLVPEPLTPNADDLAYVAIGHLHNDRLGSTREAFVVVTPSLTEGFGLPVAEALGHGCVVLSSNGGALPEAGGDLVEYFDPRRPEELALLLRRHLEDDAHHELRRDLVLEVEPKRWSQVAAEVGAVLRPRGATAVEVSLPQRALVG